MENNEIKSLNDYKDEIHRCSKCGLCQAVCPLYQSTGNECSVSRGQFIMLDGVVREKLDFSKTINKYLDMCLKCNKCSDFCPSQIEVVDILLCAKREYLKNRGKFERFLYSVLESKIIFNTILNILKSITKVFTPKVKSKHFETKAVYFGGCISALKPDIDNYVIKLLNDINIEVINTNFNCCGIPFLTTGNIERFVENLKENVNKVPQDAQMLITDCASCEWAWREYIKYIDDDTLKERLINLKIVSIYELIDKNELCFRAKNKAKLTYHKPCHEKHSENILNIIRNIKNCEYVELDGMDECCGFSSFEHPYTLKDTKPVREKKKKSVMGCSADYVLTTCVGCLFSLNLLTPDKHKNRLISFLKNNCEFDKTKK